MKHKITIVLTAKYLNDLTLIKRIFQEKNLQRNQSENNL